MTTIRSLTSSAHPAPGPMPVKPRSPDGDGAEAFGFAFTLAIRAPQPPPAPMPVIQVTPGPDQALPEVFEDVPAGRGTDLWPLPAKPVAFSGAFPGQPSVKPGRDTFPGRLSELLAAFAKGGRDALLGAADSMTDLGVTIEGDATPGPSRPMLRPGGPGVVPAPDLEPAPPVPTHGPPRGAMPPGVPLDAPEVTIIAALERAPIAPLRGPSPGLQPGAERDSSTGLAGKAVVIEAAQGRAQTTHEDSAEGSSDDGGKAAGGERTRAQFVRSSGETVAPFQARLAEVVDAPRGVNTARPGAPVEPPALPARTTDQVTLQFQSPDGLEGRLRVSLRGNALHATLIPTGLGTMRHLEERLVDLQRSLVERGFRDARVSIQPARVTEGLTVRGDLRDEGRARDDSRGGRSHPDDEAKQDSTQSRSRRRSPGRQER